MKILVLSDIHQRHLTAKKLIETVPHDKCILLGDYFDNFGDTAADAEATAKFLKDYVVGNPKIVALTGNHDVNYFYFGHPCFMCSGFTHEKKDAIRKILTQEDIDSTFKFHHIEENFVFSHAGVTVPIWKDLALYFGEDKREEETPLDFFSRVLQHYVDITYKNIRNRMGVPLLEAGWDRGGRAPHGGIIWCDFSNFASIKGVNQIVGHTPAKEPRFHLQYNDGSYTKQTASEYYRDQESFDKGLVSINVGLDTHSNHYALVEDGKVDLFSCAIGCEGASLKTLAKTAFINDSPMANVSGLTALSKQDLEDAREMMRLYDEHQKAAFPKKQKRQYKKKQ